MMNINNKEEPITAPKHDQWYNLKLGSSFKEQHPSSKFCTLRYEFKPASIDKSQPGKLLKTKDNRVTVEFQNSQPGKPKVCFEGSSEDYKENDAVLFFDGESFRLERLHRAVKRLKHVRLPGESATGSAPASVSAAAETSSPPVVKAHAFQSQSNTVRALSLEVERIDVGDVKSPGTKHKNDTTDYLSHAYQPNVSPGYPSSHGNHPNMPTGYPSLHDDQSNMPPGYQASPEAKSDDLDEQLDIMNDDEVEDNAAAGGGDVVVNEIDINKPHQNETDGEEYADVVGSDGDDDVAEAGHTGQANGEGGDRPSSSSSSSSGSDSSGSSSSSSSSSSRSGSDSGSSSSDSDSSDGETAISI